MEASLAAFLNLCALARADRRVCDAERRVLERYRKRLGIKKHMLRQPMAAEKRALVGHDSITGSPQECAHIMKMMARVAFADGQMTAREHALLSRVADTLGVGKLQFADILVSVESERIHRDRVHRGVWALGSLLGLVVLVVGLFVVFSGQGVAPNAADLDRIAALENRIDRLPDEGITAAAIQESWARLKESERALARRVAQLERGSGGAVGPGSQGGPVHGGRTAKSLSATSLSAEVAAELASLKAQLARVTDARTDGFKLVEREYRESVVLIVTRYRLVNGNRTLSENSVGTGFFVSPDGIIVTNKHVLQPWKFVPRAVKRISQGYTVDPRSVERMAWTSGQRVRLPNGRWDVSSCLYSRRGTLAVFSMARDSMTLRNRALADGSRHVGRYHASDNFDLGALKATLSSPVKPFPLLLSALQPSQDVEKLDPVMVLGFPTGTAILEGNTVETSPSVGVVRRAGDPIFVDAPIVGGNSGGPAVDSRGRVIGVATRTYGDASVGCCIRARHILGLLPKAGEFLGQARSLVRSHPRLALRCLDLAQARLPNADQLRRIEALRATCSVGLGK